MHLSKTLKIAAAAAGLLGLTAVAGCAPGYYDNQGYWHNSYHRQYDNDRDGYYHHSGDRDRRWVCDSDGDDCHWSYRD